jgi:hypothetical protein
VLTRWAFYVDESGGFDERLDRVVVAGLLLQDRPTLQPHVLKAALVRAIPLLPWPLHAAFVNQPAYVAMALYHAVSGNRHSVTGDVAKSVVRAYEVLKEHDRDRANAVARLLRHQQEPKFDDIAVLSTLLRTVDNAASERLRSHGLEAHASAARLLADLAPAKTDGWLPPIIVVTGSETEVGDAWPRSDSGDRYLNLLSTTLHRVGQVLGRFPGPHIVSVWVSRRDVVDWRLKTPVKLNTPHLNQVISELSIVPDVTILGGGVGTSWEGRGAGYVLADLAANSVRRILASRSVSILKATRDIQARLGAQAASGSPELAHCAASGRAAELISLASVGGLTKSPSTALPATVPRARWACEQAWEWAEALRG